MSHFSILLNLQAYSDAFPSNSPSMSNFKWTRALNSIPASNPTSSQFQLAPGESRTLFNGTRSISQDGTTEYSLQLVPGTANTYQLTGVSGTLPNFRTPRTTGADATTQVYVSVNGPVATFTSGPAIYASFSGQVPGLISPVVITALNSGTVGNSVVLTGDGVTTLATLIANWNTANPSNEITLTSGSGSQIPNNTGSYAFFTGTILGTAMPVTITANHIGVIGNSVVLTGDGTSSISTLITNWNTANPSNQVTLSSGDGTQIPYGGVKAQYIGVPLGCSTSITLTANVVGTEENSTVLVGDGASDINTLIANWNLANPLEQLTLTSGNGGQIPSALTVIALTGGMNPAVVNLTDGVNQNTIALAGGATPTPFNLVSGGVVVGDFVQIGDLLNPSDNVFSESNWGNYQIIAVTATSFSVSNLNAVVEGPITLGSDFANQIAIFSATGVQIGDTLQISGGFSSVSWGSYIITAVGAEYVEFYSTNALPQQSNILIESIAIYSDAKQFVYLESDQNCAVVINGTISDTIQPFILPTNASNVGGVYGPGTPPGVYPALTGTSLNPSVRPGMFMRTSTIYSLTVTNNSSTTANLFLAAIE